MKKNSLSLILVSTLCALSIATAKGDDEQPPKKTKTVSSDAVWQATAKKDTESELVVVATGGALSFDYSAAKKSFNTQMGEFSVDIVNSASTARDFKLIAKVDEKENILTRATADGTGSTLTVGTKWNNEVLESNQEMELIDASDYDNLNDLSKLIGTKDERVNTLSKFTFYIKTGKKDSNSTEIAHSDFSEFPDGTWSGNVTVKFKATWSES